jgi:hypothetical protein
MSAQAAVAALLGLLFDMHGEQDGAINQQVALGRIDIAPVSVLAEDRGDLLKSRINTKYRDHSSHLQTQRYRLGCPAAAGALVLD